MCGPLSALLHRDLVYVASWRRNSPSTSSIAALRLPQTTRLIIMSTVADATLPAPPPAATQKISSTALPSSASYIQSPKRSTWENAPPPSARGLADGDFDPSRGAKPQSPFYQHPTTQTSLEQLRSEAPTYGRGYSSQDLESNFRMSHKLSLDTQNPKRTLWTKSDRKNARWLRRLSRKQRVAVKLLFALIILGTMVGIGLGISMAVGGGVWRPHNQQSAIG